MGRFLQVVLAWSVVVTVFAGEPDPHSIINAFNNGYGVASVAGVTSRNGRVSSVSGVNFFPSGTNPFYFPTARSGDKIPEPISFTKQEDGRLTAGQIKYGPSGSVSVTSIARSVLPEDSTKDNSAVKMSDQLFKPSDFKPRDFKASDMIFQDPFATLSSRSFNPWFPNMFMFRQPTFQSMNTAGTAFPAYSNFSPLFNYWRR